MIVEQSKQIIAEVNKAFIGKNDIIEKILMTIYAGGHVLLEDCPGVGKTTLALAFSKVLGLSCKRIQFTTDTLPSDITGFTMFNRETNSFEYRDGAANCQLLLADEINRTSPKTQSALLEVMQEHTITVVSAGPFYGVSVNRLSDTGTPDEHYQCTALSESVTGAAAGNDGAERDRGTELSDFRTDDRGCAAVCNLTV